MIQRLARLCHFPALFGSFVVGTLAMDLPAVAHAQQPTCKINYVLEIPFDCFTDVCSLSYSYVQIRIAHCGGCCIHGTATVTCDGVPDPEPLHLCADCGGSNSVSFYCPTGGIQAELIVSCTSCP